MKKGVLVMLSTMLVCGGIAFALSFQEGQYLPRLGKEHRRLQEFEGTWDAVAKFQMEPGKPSAESKGVETDKVVCGGFWLVFDYKGEMEGQEFTGHGILGYDIAKKKYVGTWIDSMVTRLDVSEGDFDESGKKLTMHCEGPDPKTGKMVKMRTVTELIDADTKKLTFNVEGEDGKFVEIGSVEYKKRK